MFYSAWKILTFCNQAILDQVMTYWKWVDQEAYNQRFQIEYHFKL